MVTRVVPTGTFPGKTVNGPYTLKSADLQATFAHPTNPAMPPPTGTPTYEPAAGTKLNAGTHTITASYPGDNNYAPTTVAAIFFFFLESRAFTVWRGLRAGPTRSGGEGR